MTSKKFSWQHRIHHFVAKLNFVFNEKSIVKFNTLFKSKNFAHYDLYNDFNEIFYNIKNIATKLLSKIVLNDFHVWQILKKKHRRENEKKKLIRKFHITKHHFRHSQKSKSSDKIHEFKKNLKISSWTRLRFFEKRKNVSQSSQNEFMF